MSSQGPRRIVIIGTTGSGKSVLAQQAAQALGIPFIELDALYWGPNWHEPDKETFRRRVDQATSGEAWVVAGNYSSVRDLLWRRADTVVWLKYPLVISLWRLFWRTIRRVRTQENLWNSGNVETYYKQFLTTDSLFVWAFKSHFRRDRQVRALMGEAQYAHITFVLLAFPWHARQWLQVLQRYARQTAPSNQEEQI